MRERAAFISGISLEDTSEIQPAVLLETIDANPEAYENRPALCRTLYERVCGILVKTLWITAVVFRIYTAI